MFGDHLKNFRVILTEIDENYPESPSSQPTELTEKIYSTPNDSLSPEIFEYLQLPEIIELSQKIPQLTEEYKETDLKIREDVLKPTTLSEVIDVIFPPQEKYLPKLPIRSTEDAADDNFISNESERVKLIEKEEEDKREKLTIQHVEPQTDSKVLYGNMHYDKIEIIFSHPMIALSNESNNNNQILPIKIAPNIEGNWVWVSVNQIRFIAKDKKRFNGATKYKVTIHSGIRSILPNIAPLENDFTFEFLTASPKIHNVKILNKNPLKPIFIFTFNQKISKKTLNFISITNRLFFGLFGTDFQFELLNEDSEIIKSLEIPENSFAISVIQPIPFDTTYNIYLKNIISLEGPIQMNPIHYYESYQGTPNKFKLWHSDDVFEYFAGEKEEINMRIGLTNQIANNQNLIDFLVIKSNTTNQKFEFQMGENNSLIRFKAPSNLGKITLEIDRNLTDIYGQKFIGNNKITLKFVNRKYDTTFQRLSSLPKRYYVQNIRNENKFPFTTRNFKELQITIFNPSIFDYQNFIETIPNRTYEIDPKKTIWDLINEKNYPKILNKVFDIEDPHFNSINWIPNYYFHTGFDYSNYLNEVKNNNIIIVIQPTRNSLYRPFFSIFSDQYWIQRPIILNWINNSDLSLHAKFIGVKVVILVFSKKSNQPISNVKIYSDKDNDIGITGEDGILIDQRSKISSKYLYAIAENGDSSLVPLVDEIYEPLRMIFYIIDDRKLYKPKEEVHIKGIIRLIEEINQNEKLTIPQIGSKIVFSVTDSRESKFIKDEEFLINEFGAFELIFVIPDNINLGDANVDFTFEGEKYKHIFQIEEFRTKEFEVKVLNLSDGPYFTSIQPNQYHLYDQYTADYLQSKKLTSTFKISKLLNSLTSQVLENNNFNIDNELFTTINNKAIFEASAKYYAGLSLSNVNVDWRISASLKPFTTNFWSDYSFESHFAKSNHLPKWPGFSQLNSDCEFKPINLSHQSITNSKGRNRVLLSFEGEINPANIVNLLVESSVTDINFQSVSSSRTISVFPADLFIGIKRKKENSNKLLFIVINPMNPSQLIGNIPIFLKVVPNNFYRDIPSSYILLSSNEHPIVIKLPNFSSIKIIHAFIRDQYGRLHSSSLFDFQVTYQSTFLNSDWHNKRYKQKKIIFCDEEEFSLGEIAKFGIHSPSSPSFILISIIVNQFKVDTKIFQLSENDEKNFEFELQIEENYFPGFTLHISVYDIFNYIEYEDFHSFSISKEVKQLKVKIIPESENLSPSSETDIMVEILSPDNIPIDEAEVLLFIVDDSILSLSSYSFSNPLDIFYAVRNIKLIDNNYFDQTIPPLLKDKQIKQVIPNNMEVINGDSMKLTNASNSITSTKNSNEGNNDDDDGDMEEGDEEQGGGVIISNSFETESKGNFGIFSKRKRSSNFARYDDINENIQSFNDDKEITLKKSNIINNINNIIERSDFNALVLFESKIAKNGKVLFHTKMKDSITRYQIFAMASTKMNLFGNSSKSISVCLPISIRPSPPLFLNFGDKNVEIPIILSNQIASEVHLSFLLTCSNFKLENAISIDKFVINNNENETKKKQEYIAYKVTIPPMGRKKIIIKGDPINSGKAIFQVIIDWRNFNDLIKFEIPILTPITKEYYSISGSLNNQSSIQIPISIPNQIAPLFGNLGIKISTTILESLGDCFIHLIDYPYQCNEQLSSQVIPLIIMKNLAQNLLQKSTVEIDQIILEKINLISKRQHNEGGFGFWSKEDKFTSPIVSCQIGLMFAFAKENSLPFEQIVYEKLLFYLQKITKFSCLKSLPFFSLFVDWHNFSFSLFARLMMGDDLSDIASKAIKLFDVFDRKMNLLSIEIQSWLLIIFHTVKKSKINFTAKQQQKINKNIEEILIFFTKTIKIEGEIAFFLLENFERSSEMEDYFSLQSPIRSTAIALYSLLHINENHILIPKLVKFILSERRNGIWRNTQENFFALFALQKYFLLREKEVPNFQSRVWLDHLFIGRVNVDHRSLSSLLLSLPLHLLPENNNNNNNINNNNKLNNSEKEEGRRELYIEKEGEGRMYYNITMTYARKELIFQPIERGFCLSRKYFLFNSDLSSTPLDHSFSLENNNLNLDRNFDLHLDQQKEIFFCPINTKIKIELEISSLTRNYNIVLVDYLPAGFEVINVNIDSFSSSSDQFHQSNDWDHVNYRNERVEAFLGISRKGVRKFSYLVRAITRGKFLIPSASVEEMYSPELFARSSSSLIVIQ